MKKLLSIAIFALVFLLGATGARADSADGVTFTLVQADLSGSAGDVLTWEYDVTNHSGGTIFGNSIDSSLFNSGTGDTSPFDFFGSGIADGASLTGPLFAFNSDPGVMTSFNSGIFDLNLLLPDGVSTVDLFADYSATITSGTPVVPEPSPLLLAGSGLACLLALRRLLA